MNNNLNPYLPSNTGNYGVNERNPFYPMNYNPQNFPQRPSLKNLIDQELEKIVPQRGSSGFGSVQYRPKKISFASQNEGEIVYVLVRRHWIKNIGWIFNNLLYAIIPFIILWVLSLLKVDLSFLNFRVYFIIFLAYYSIIFTNVIRSFFDWYFDPFIITNERVIAYDFKPFTSYKIQEAPLDTIEDVEEISQGFLPGLFNYGDLKVRTSSTEGELLFDDIYQPTRVRDVLTDLVKIIRDYNYGGRNN